MNNGKICIPVCAGTAEHMLEQIGRAEKLTDVIELRLDCLETGEVSRFMSRIADRPGSKPLLATFRSPEQGGRGSATRQERVEWWGQLNDLFFAADLEEDVMATAPPASTLIASHHDFDGVPPDLEQIFDRLAASGADVVKIAATTSDIAEAIPVWRLLKRGASIGRGVIPVAMGEAGKWVRLLALAHGAYLTYASLEDGKGTAEGQITADEMISVYRVRELTPETRVFGVIGDPVSSSLSPYMHNAAFAESGVDAVFMHLQVKDLDAFISRMVKPETREVELNFGGFSVTMPHKQAVMKYLDEVDPAAREIGAVNTVRIQGGRLIGSNTDAHGFIEPLKERFGDLRGASVALFGAGGAARACAYALKQEGADVMVFVRDPARALAFEAQFGVTVASMSEFRSETGRMSGGGFDIIVNATPLGMKGARQDETLLTAAELGALRSEPASGVKFVFDLVTRIDETPLLREARAAGVPAMGGLEMLIAQGAKQFEIWTGKKAPVGVMRAAVERRMNG